MKFKMCKCTKISKLQQKWLLFWSTLTLRMIVRNFFCSKKRISSFWHSAFLHMSTLIFLLILWPFCVTWIVLVDHTGFILACVDLQFEHHAEAQLDLWTYLISFKRNQEVCFAFQKCFFFFFSAYSLAANLFYNENNLNKRLQISYDKYISMREERDHLNFKLDEQKRHLKYQCFFTLRKSGWLCEYLKYGCSCKF